MDTGLIETDAFEDTRRSQDRRPAPELAANAVIFEGTRTVSLRRVPLTPLQGGDVVVDMMWSGVSTGTERLMWSGEMPSFPGMGYPLVPGYEGIGRIIHAPDAPARVGEIVFIPGARCFEGVHGLFGASASRLVVPGDKARRIDLARPEEGALLALAATAYHAVNGPVLPDLVIGHGVLGRLVARVIIALGGAPIVWEINPERMGGAVCPVVNPQDDTRRDYRSICDVSGDSAILDKALPHLARGGEIILAGFYSSPPAFNFPIAFRKEMRLRVAAEWAPADLDAVIDLAAAGRLDLSSLVTHTSPACDAASAYTRAFEDSSCLKLLIDWTSTDE